MATGDKAMASMLAKASKVEPTEDTEDTEAYGTEDCAKRLCAAMGVDEGKASEVANILSEFIEAHMGEE